MADLPTPHDALFRALLSDPERARDFLRDHLPVSFSSRLADTPPETIEGGFVDEALAGSQSDLLLRVGLAAGGDAFVYVLVEHKSTPDPGLPLQLASYMVRIWKRYAGTSATRLRALPPIVPVVVFHGPADWTVPGSLDEMIAGAAPDLAFLPGSGYILRNLHAMDIDALSTNAALRAGFITLRREALGFLAEIAES
ncbi:MAG: Rpn family recombination-promoting nuclease/putative transposase, partial [Rhodobacter sp.]|nr:Rpn family recombination-promoting nuclease/putative transposase [Rhodobacter sp.]MCY4241749.1 Rpn family recombination-promoting nuclease/putative transposase [Rhodobacter sp.]